MRNTKLKDTITGEEFEIDEWGRVLTPEGVESKRYFRAIELMNELFDLVSGPNSVSWKLAVAQEGNCRLLQANEWQANRIKELQGEK